MDAPLVVKASHRRQRIHKLAIVREHCRGKVRFKLAGYYVDGKRRRKYFDDRASAETFIEAEQVRRLNLGRRATHISGSLAEDAVRASDELKSTPYSILEAARVLAAAHARLAPFGVGISLVVEKYVGEAERRGRSVTINALVEEFTASRKAKGKTLIYLRDLRTRLGRFKLTFGGRSVSDFSPGEIDDWLQALAVGPQTQNNFRAVLSAMWGFAVRRGYADTNIVRLVDKSSVARDHVPVFSVEELARLLTAAPPAYLPVLAIGAFAGLRPEEIKKLRWEDIDVQERTIRVNATSAKTRRKRFAELSDNLVSWLVPYAGRTGPVAPPNLRRIQRGTMTAAGISRWPQDGLRHSFASAHYAFHKNPAHTAMLLGHRDQAMLLTHYRDLMQPSDAARYWNLVPHHDSDRKIVSMQGA